MGKKSVSWRKDPNILARLKQVEALHLENISNMRIADALKVDEKTVRNDLKRIQSIWMERLGTDIEGQRARSIAMLRRVQETAWRDQRNVKENAQNRASMLSIIESCEARIAKLQGTESPTKVDLRLIAAEIAEQMGLDPADVLREAESIIHAKTR